MLQAWLREVLNRESVNGGGGRQGFGDRWGIVRNVCSHAF